MARIGPNQDINDPTTIIQTAFEYQQKSDSAGNFLAQFNARNPNVTGSPIIDISIPFKMEDGYTQFLEGSNIDLDDEKYIYDENLVSNSTLVTYVDLAERFRIYWATLNNVLDQLDDYSYLQETDIDPEGPFVVIIGGNTRTHGSLGGIAYDQESYYHLPSGSLSTPAWTGVGPTNYNQLTYPQLLNELYAIDIQQSSSSAIWDTIYWYDKNVDNSGDVRGATAFFGKERIISPIDQQYIQFHNGGSSAIEIEMSINISATIDSRFSTSYSSWAEIDDINSYPDPFGGLKSLLSSYISYTEEKLSPGGTTTLSTTRTIEIPPGKSAFVGCGAGAGTSFGTIITVGTVDIIIILNGETLTHSANLT